MTAAAIRLLPRRMCPTVLAFSPPPSCHGRDHFFTPRCSFRKSITFVGVPPPSRLPLLEQLVLLGRQVVELVQVYAEQLRQRPVPVIVLPREQLADEPRVVGRLAIEHDH